MDRPITPAEAAVIEWLLENAAVGKRSGNYQTGKITKDLVVSSVPKCACGCRSLDFLPDGWGNAEIVSDAYAVYPDGLMAGLILWGREGKLALLEIYDLHPESSRRFPEVKYLCLTPPPPGGSTANA
jgi:hypothetical protein